MKKNVHKKVNEKNEKVPQHTKKEVSHKYAKESLAKTSIADSKCYRLIDNDSIHDLIKLHNRISSRYPATVSLSSTH